jgi:hypothetical protein
MIQTGQAWFSEELKTECEFLSYPLYFMDFEPVNPAIPRFSGMHPYDHPLSDCDCSRKWMSGQADALTATKDRGRFAEETRPTATLRETPSAGRTPSLLDFYLSWMSPGFPDSFVVWK